MKPVYEHSANILVGRKHTGKSTFLNKLAIDVSLATGKKVLIVDVNMSPAYSAHQLLSPEKFPAWCRDQGRKNYKKIKRFYLPDEKLMLSLIADNFRDGLIIFEDCTKYIESNPKREVKNFLVDHRMHRNDLIFTFHALNFVPPFFWRMTNRVTIFKTQDQLSDQNFNRYAERIPGYKQIYQGWQKVMQGEDPFKNITVETLQ